MKWSYRIARVAGIEVRIHLTFPLLLAFYAWICYDYAGAEAARDGVLFTLLLFFCVLLHEFGHAFAARAFGIRTPDITLLPIGGVAWLEKIPSSPWQEFVIAIAGPAVNVGIALALIAVNGGVPPLEEMGNFNPLADSLAMRLLKINVLLVVFNMIPAFPMDGGRILRAVLATAMPHATATLIAARVGQTIAVIFGVAGPLWLENPMLAIIAIFIFMGAQQELHYARMRQVAKGLRVGSAMITRFATIPSDLALENVPSLLLGTNQGIFPIVDEDLLFRGLADRETLLKTARELPPAQTAVRAARRVPAARPEMGFDEVLDLMQKSAEPVLPVINSSGQIVGLVDIGQLERAGGDESR